MQLSFQPLILGLSATAVAGCSLAFRLPRHALQDRRTMVLKHVFWVYVCCVIALTMLPMFEFPDGRENTRINLNLEPFSIIKSDWDKMIHGGTGDYTQAMATVNLWGNLIMLTPLGLLGPIVYPRMRRVWHWALVGLLFSTCIELTQLAQTYLKVVGNRYCDIDDVILNTSGCIIGAMLSRRAEALIMKLPIFRQ